MILPFNVTCLNERDYKPVKFVTIPLKIIKKSYFTNKYLKSYSNLHPGL